MKISKKKLITVAIVLFGIGAIYNFSSGASKVKQIQVKKVAVTNRVVSKTVSASGTVKALQSADLSFAASQTVQKIYVRKGDEITKNQLLAVIDGNTVANNTKASKDTRDYYVRARDIFLLNEKDNRDTLGNKEFELKLRQYNEQVDQYEAAYQAAISTLNNYYIYAPFSGTVLDIYKEEGEMALAGETVLKVADLSNVEFEISVDQEDYGLLKADLAGEINLDAYDNKSLQGKVKTLPLYADGSSNPTFIVKLSFDNTAELNPLVGMTGDVKIIVETSQNEVPSIYYDELFFDEEKKPYLWIVENGYLTKKYVEIGIEGDLYTELKAKVDSQIVVGLTPDLELKDGYKALIVK